MVGYTYRGSDAIRGLLTCMGLKDLGLGPDD